MNENLLEFVSSSGHTLRLDRASNVLRGVKLLGLASRNGRRYQERALREAMSLYDGAKVNVNHPLGDPLAPRDYRDRIGVIRNVEVRAGEGLFGSQHFNPKHPLAEQLVWDAEHAPENVGLSHNVLARTRHEEGQTVVEAITHVQSVDLVADPAATRGLFEHEVGEPHPVPFDALTRDELALHRPDLVEGITASHRALLAEAQTRLAEVTRQRDQAMAQRLVAREQTLLTHPRRTRSVDEFVAAVTRR